MQAKSAVLLYYDSSDLYPVVCSRLITYSKGFHFGETLLGLCVYNVHTVYFPLYI